MNTNQYMFILSRKSIIYLIWSYISYQNVFNIDVTSKNKCTYVKKSVNEWVIARVTHGQPVKAEPQQLDVTISENNTAYTCYINTYSTVWDFETSRYLSECQNGITTVGKTRATKCRT